MNVNFSYQEPGTNDPVVFSEIIGQKSGGGIVANPSFDIQAGTAVGYNNGVLNPIKAYRLSKAVAAADTTIEIVKGSGVAVGDVIGYGTKSVACTAVDQSNATKDVVTVTLGVAIPSGTVLYQAASASASAAVPIYTPSFLTGEIVYAGKGDQNVALINFANVRKETVNASPEVLALLQTIKIV
jgi:hypothetical protein